MKSAQSFLPFLIFCIWTAYSFCNGQNALSSVITTADGLVTKSSLDNQVQKIIKLDNGFEIKAGQKESFEKFETFTLLIITHKDKQIYIDTSLTEYEFGDNLYPMVRQLENETFEILVEVNDRPNKNYLKYFKVRHDKIVSTEEFPSFFSKPSNLDTEDNLEYAGFWDWGEVWGDDNSVTAYNPIIYYELRPNGIVIDSALTIRKNKEIYGDFYGFRYNEKIEVKTSETGKRDKEIYRIKGINNRTHN